MRKSKADLVELMATGKYHVVQKVHDWNHDDLIIRRDDGSPAGIVNYPYRIDQMPAYVFRELLRDGMLREDGKDASGGAIFRVTEKLLHLSRKAA